MNVKWNKTIILKVEKGKREVKGWRKDTVWTAEGKNGCVLRHISKVSSLSNSEPHQSYGVICISWSIGTEIDPNVLLSLILLLSLFLHFLLLIIAVDDDNNDSGNNNINNINDNVTEEKQMEHEKEWIKV